MNRFSAASSTGQLSALSKWHLTHNVELPVFDFGAGKEGLTDKAFKDSNVPYFPFDPFCRSEKSNQSSLNALNEGSCAYVLCSNVLNVIEDEHLDEVIKSIKNCADQTWLKCAWVSVYHKANLPINRHLRGYFQRNLPIEWYKHHLEKEFKNVEQYKKFLVCKN